MSSGLRMCKANVPSTEKGNETSLSRSSAKKLILSRSLPSLRHRGRFCSADPVNDLCQKSTGNFEMSM